MTRKFLLAALVILLAALCTVHLTTERTPPENVVSPPSTWAWWCQERRWRS
ncbi:MAG: hypothetical protein ACLUIX_03640 [Oscillospiraceae bacterium]